MKSLVELESIDGYEYKVFKDGYRIGTLGVGLTGNNEEIKAMCLAYFRLDPKTTEVEII